MRQPLFLCAALLVATAACGLIDFDVEQPIPEQTVQGSPIPNVLPLGLFQIPLTIDLDAATKSKGTGPASAAYLKSLSLEIRSPASGTFEFVDQITISVAADGLPAREIAKLDPVPGQKRIDLGVLGEIDLLPYIKKGAKLSASAAGQLPPTETKFDGKVVIRVKV